MIGPVGRRDPGYGQGTVTGGGGAQCISLSMHFTGRVSPQCHHPLHLRATSLPSPQLVLLHLCTSPPPHPVPLCCTFARHPLPSPSSLQVGIKEGGRTGLVAVTVGVCFLASLFVSPLIQVRGLRGGGMEPSHGPGKSDLAR